MASMSTISRLTNSGQPAIKILTVRLAFMTVVEFLVFLVFASSGTAQTIEVKIVNGQNGHPMADKCLYVWVGDRANPNAGPLLETQTDTHGVIRLQLTHEDPKTNGQSQRLVCGLQGVINPIVKIGDTISIRSGYVLCQPRAPEHSWLARKDFSMEDALQNGIVTENTCGQATALRKPGEVILFVRPLTWWEKLKQ
jgi:hypothetical protein